MVMETKCIYCKSSSSSSNPIVASDSGSGVALFGVCKSCLVGACEALNGDGAQVDCNDGDSNDAVIKSRLSKVMKPREIVEYLDKSIISQNIAKRELACAVYEHMKRKIIFDVTGECGIKKANVLMLGKSGVSKTEMIRQLVNLMDFPMITVDCTSLSESGYVGDSIDDKMVSLVDRADGDLLNASFGIVFLDEVDKLRRAGGSSQTTANVGHEGVQEALLKVIEGTEMTVSVGGQQKASGRATKVLDTSNILFVASGAFDGIEALLDSGSETEIGFVKTGMEGGKDKTKLYREIRNKHLIEYGFKQEFIGRFNNFVAFDELTESDLVEILQKSSLSRIKESILSLGYDGCDLSFTEDSFDAIAKIAIKEKTGARALGKIVDTLLRGARYAASNGELKEFVVDAECVKSVYKE